jgi:hypothetical protein
MIDVIKIDVPTFIRLLELAREDVKNDPDLHDLTQKVVAISQERVVTMADYKDIVGFMKKQGSDEELNRIRTLGGL